MLPAAASVLVLSACPQAAQWRNTQVARMQQASSTSRLTPPAQPLAIPAQVAAALPLDPSFTPVQYTATSAGDSVSLVALSAWDTTDTATWMITWLAQRGYQSDDNPSRILEGVEYANAEAPYRTLWVQVTLNTADQCVVTIQATE